MINVSRVVNSPRLAQTYIVWRRSGYWSEGEFVEDENKLQYYGPVTPANSKDIEQLPEGDRVKGLMVFYSNSADKPLCVTRDDPNDKGTSDQIEWHGERYRLLQVFPWSDYGYWKAIGARMKGK